MFRFSKMAILGLTLGTGLVLSGCTANGGAKSPAVAATPEQAVSCSKCQVTWVKVPETSKGRVIGYSNRKSMVCPDCKDAVANFFATGNLQHTCKTCGDSMDICEAH